MAKLKGSSRWSSVGGIEVSGDTMDFIKGMTPEKVSDMCVDIIKRDVVAFNGMLHKNYLRGQSKWVRDFYGDKIPFHESGGALRAITGGDWSKIATNVRLANGQATLSVSSKGLPKFSANIANASARVNAWERLHFYRARYPRSAFDSSGFTNLTRNIKNKVGFSADLKAQRYFRKKRKLAGKSSGDHDSLESSFKKEVASEVLAGDNNANKAMKWLIRSESSGGRLAVIKKQTVEPMHLFTFSSENVEEFGKSLSEAIDRKINERMGYD